MRKEGHESRFNLKRIEYTLKAEVHAFTSRDGLPGHYVRMGGQESDSASSSLGWTDTTLTARADIPGDANMTTQSGATIFTAESGAGLTYYNDGSFLYAASLQSPVAKRELLLLEQAGLPWWEKAREVIENEYIYEAGRVDGDPVYGESKRNGTPYKYFRLSVPVSESETKEFDVYAYGQAISLITRRNIHKDDVVRLRASVQFHEQRQPHGSSLYVPWLNLFNVQRLT